MAGRLERGRTIDGFRLEEPLHRGGMAALLGHARQLQADHVVIRARGSSAVRRYLGSVSSEVAAEALCSVAVVRARAWREGVREGESTRSPEPPPAAAFPSAADRSSSAPL